MVELLTSTMALKQGLTFPLYEMGEQCSNLVELG